MSIQVRLIKCTIENIIVDISFNQTGGICALCFLELVINAFLFCGDRISNILCSSSKPFLLIRHLACSICSVGHLTLVSILSRCTLSLQCQVIIKKSCSTKSLEISDGSVFRLIVKLEKAIYLKGASY
jgi:hypothetical protein